MNNNINEKILQEKISDVLKQIPDGVLKIFMKRAIEDVKQVNNNITPEELEKLSYIVFRAYCIGYVVKF